MKTGRKSKSEKGKEEEKRRERSLPGREKKGGKEKESFPAFFLVIFKNIPQQKKYFMFQKMDNLEFGLRIELSLSLSLLL